MYVTQYADDVISIISYVVLCCDHGGTLGSSGASCLVGGAENSSPRRSSSGRAGEEELRAGAGQTGERTSEPGETRPGGQGIGAVPAGGCLCGNACQPQTGPGEQGGRAESQTTVRNTMFFSELRSGQLMRKSRNMLSLEL